MLEVYNLKIESMADRTGLEVAPNYTGRMVFWMEAEKMKAGGLSTFIGDKWHTKYFMVNLHTLTVYYSDIPFDRQIPGQKIVSIPMSVRI
jgi:hypothetical protein